VQTSTLFRRGMGYDKRIGFEFLFPGVGYGGSCFPKDVKALVQTAQKHRIDAAVLKAVEAVNEEQKKVIFRKIMEHFRPGRAENGLWGKSPLPAGPLLYGACRSSRALTTCARLLRSDHQ